MRFATFCVEQIDLHVFKAVMIIAASLCRHYCHVSAHRQSESKSDCNFWEFSIGDYLSVKNTIISKQMRSTVLNSFREVINEY